MAINAALHREMVEYALQWVCSCFVGSSTAITQP